MPDGSVATIADPEAVDRAVNEELAGLDANEVAGESRVSLGRRLWSASWPKLAAIALFLLLWQFVVWTGWKPEFVLPPPSTVFAELWSRVADGTMFEAISTTVQRAAIGYAAALAIGLLIGAAVSRVKVLRTAVGSMITGLQTMPSIAWFPLAVVLFKGGEAAITFVVIVGAAPAIANGLISGIDNIPPLLLRAGRVLGANGWAMFRHIVMPAALPGFVGGLKQGWAFAWRSLLAGELIVLTGRLSIGAQLTNARDMADVPWLMSVMIVIFVIGVTVDSVFFGTIERRIRSRWGLDTA